MVRTGIELMRVSDRLYVCVDGDAGDGVGDGYRRAGCKK